MKRFRIWTTSLTLLCLVAFWPNHAQSRQYFEATMRFNPRVNTQWHYFTTVLLIGNEIQREKRNRVGGVIWTVYDEMVDSSGGGLVGTSVAYNTYEALDLGTTASQYEKPTGGPLAPPGYSSPGSGDSGESAAPPCPDLFGFGSGSNNGEGPGPMQAIGGGGGGGTTPGSGGGAGGGDQLLGEGQFEILPILESNVNYIMSESGRLLDLSGMELIGNIIDPSRSITVRQVFQTTHLLVLPDYQVHLNEQWRAPMSWTVPMVGETMEIPLTYRLADLRTTFRFRVAAIEFSGILQFNVDVSDEGMLPDENGKLQSVRKESNIKGDIIIQGRAYLDLDRGVIVAVCDGVGSTYFVDGTRRGNELFFNDIGMPWPLNPGFYAQLSFERRDLYTPLGNVIDRRPEVSYKMQDMQWFTTTVVE